MYKVLIEKKVSKFLSKHKGEKLVSLFSEKIILLSKNPYSLDLDIKALAGKVDKYRLRIGKYRFLYEVNNNTITISFFDADSRGGIYK